MNSKRTFYYYSYTYIYRGGFLIRITVHDTFWKYFSILANNHRPIQGSWPKEGIQSVLWSELLRGRCKPITMVNRALEGCCSHGFRGPRLNLVKAQQMLMTYFPFYASDLHGISLFTTSLIKSKKRSSRYFSNRMDLCYIKKMNPDLFLILRSIFTNPFTEKKRRVTVIGPYICFINVNTFPIPNIIVVHLLLPTIICSCHTYTYRSFEIMSSG